MICSSCGTENKPGRRFCVECGAGLASACAACGTPFEPGEKFCGSCGTRLATADGAGRPPTAVAEGGSPAGAVEGMPGAGPGETVAERRVVSVLFADLVEFTAMAEGRDAEETRELLDGYFTLSRDVITRHGGTVEKFIGDAVMAVWGAPIAREDDAERAVRAALDLVDAVRGLSPDVRARAGVLTGEAAVTIGAIDQGMVAGDLVNTAARLQSAAMPGTVLVGEATQRAAGRAIAFEPVGDQVLKGKAAPVPAWRALRVVARIGGRDRGDQLEAPFVGRAEDLRLLKDLFHATTRERRARLVSVFGPAGIGKTRLAREFLNYVDGLREDVWWHEGRSPAYGEGIAFWALGEMVRRRCGLAETDDEATTRAKVAEALAEHVPDADERRWIEGALLVLLGLESGTPADQLFGAWRTFFERLAATQPVVMVFEDFHFADPGLLDFVDHLIEWSKGMPIHVLTLTRPELLERRPDWGAGKRNYVSLSLEPLAEPEMRDLLRGLIPGLPDPAVTAIIGRADGIPLYAVETVRMLLAEGRLTLVEGVYQPTGDLAHLAVPETLTALIASRLDALDPTERSLLQDAAVLGQSFTPTALAAVSGHDEEALEPTLRTLVRRELLVLDVDPRSPERGQYAFVQALIREVAYGTLARRDRKTRHLAAARFFEGLGSDELAGALASHYLAAQANATEGPEADALAGQARLALRGAADRAAALGSHDQAVSFLEQALTVATDPREQAELLDQAGDEAIAGGLYAVAEELLLRSLELRREAGEPRAAAATVTLLGKAHLGGRRPDRALDLLGPAIEEFASIAPDPVFIALEAQYGRALFLNDQHREALVVIERVLEAAEHADTLDILADALVTRGSALGSIGRTQEGLGVIEIGERIARANGLNQTEMRALNNRLATLYDFEIRAGVETAREGLALARRNGDRPMLFSMLAFVGFGLQAAGDLDGCLAAFEAGLAEDPEPADGLVMRYGVIDVRAARGEPVAELLVELDRLASGMSDQNVTWATIEAPAVVDLYNGRFEEAARRWRDGAGRFATLGPQWLASAADAALFAGETADAATDLAALDGTGFHTPWLELRRRGIRAGLAALEGRRAQAARDYRDALQELLDRGYGWTHALMALQMTTLLGPSEPDVVAAAEIARETLERARAKLLLQRLDAALGDGGVSGRARTVSSERRAHDAGEPEAVAGEPDGS
jgi:class 3 adenylate cyclase/tetratricopeptide (TPR) repeat protein